MATASHTVPTTTRAAEKQASRDKDAAAMASRRKTAQELRRENEAFAFDRSAVSIVFARSFSR